MTLLQGPTTKVLLSGVLLFVACGFADIIPATDPLGPITVMNPSFETPPLGGFPGSCGPSCSFGAGVPGWTVSGNGGELRPGPGGGTLFNTIPDGITVAFSNSGTISQTVTPTVEPGVTYVLTVDLGRRSDSAFTSSAELLAGTTVVATAIGIVPTAGNWSPFTATFTGSAADAGEPITIRLLSTGRQSAFDDVRLMAVPESPFR